MTTTALTPETERAMHRIDRTAMAARVLAETENQVAKWGIQHHPDGTSPVCYGFLADMAKRTTDKAADAGTLTWSLIAFEEVVEAFAESDRRALVEELVQAAAVFVSWAVDIENRPHA